jgi:hypothetical protein
MEEQIWQTEAVLVTTSLTRQHVGSKMMHEGRWDGSGHEEKREKKIGVISLNPHELSRLLQTPLQTSKALTLVYQTRICFQFPPSVRVFREILTDRGVNYPFIPHSKTTSFWALKLHRFGLQNDVVLAILSLIFFKKKKEKKKKNENIYKKKRKKKGVERNRGVAGATPTAGLGVVRPPPKAQKKKKKKKTKNGFLPFGGGRIHPQVLRGGPATPKGRFGLGPREELSSLSPYSSLPFFFHAFVPPLLLASSFFYFSFFLLVFIAFVGFPPLPAAFGGMFCSGSLSNSSSLFFGHLCCHQPSSVGICMGLCWCLNCGSPKPDLVSSIYFSLPRAPPASSLVHHLSPAVLRDHVVLSHATAV